MPFTKVRWKYLKANLKKPSDIFSDEKPTEEKKLKAGPQEGFERYVCPDEPIYAKAMEWASTRDFSKMENSFKALEKFERQLKAAGGFKGFGLYAIENDGKKATALGIYEPNVGGKELRFSGDSFGAPGSYLRFCVDESGHILRSWVGNLLNGETEPLFNDKVASYEIDPTLGREGIADAIKSILSEKKAKCEEKAKAFLSVADLYGCAISGISANAPKADPKAKPAEGMPRTGYIVATETNSWEGEAWHFLFKAPKNAEQEKAFLDLKSILDRVGDGDFEIDVSRSEPCVPEHGSTTYMAEWNDEGEIDPKKVDELKTLSPDDLYNRLYKGGLANLSAG